MAVVVAFAISANGGQLRLHGKLILLALTSLFLTITVLLYFVLRGPVHLPQHTLLVRVQKYPPSRRSH